MNGGAGGSGDGEAMAIWAYLGPVGLYLSELIVSRQFLSYERLIGLSITWDSR